jgi:hypothetical protein
LQHNVAAKNITLNDTIYTIADKLNNKWEIISNTPFTNAHYFFGWQQLPLMRW